MNWRTLGVALMVVGVVAAATGTFGAGIIEADRSTQIDSVEDSSTSIDGNYFDTRDPTEPEDEITRFPIQTLVVYNHYAESLRMTRIEVTAIEPVNASANATTTDPSVVTVPSQYGFGEGSTLGKGDSGPIPMQCNSAFNGTVDAQHSITVATTAEAVDSGTEFSLARTVTLGVRCNA